MKGGISNDPDYHLFYPGLELIATRQCPRGQKRRLVRQLPEAINIQIFLGQIKGGSYCPMGCPVLLGRHQTHVAFRKDGTLKARNGSQDGEATVPLNGGA